MLGRVIADQVIREAKSGQTKPALMLREAVRIRGEAARVTFGRRLAERADDFSTGTTPHCVREPRARPRHRGAEPGGRCSAARRSSCAPRRTPWPARAGGGGSCCGCTARLREAIEAIDGFSPRTTFTPGIRDGRLPGKRSTGRHPGVGCGLKGRVLTDGDDEEGALATDRHKVFLSFHHQLDEDYKNAFCELLGTSIVDKSVKDGDIDSSLKVDTVRSRIRDEFIADATVTIVLVGRCTWQRKHVDWEIGSSLRDTKKNSRCGLLGILLPCHPDHGRTKRRNWLIPPRLADNVGERGSFAEIYDWPVPWDRRQVRGWIHQAFERRSSSTPNNARPQFARNRSGWCADGWSD